MLNLLIIQELSLSERGDRKTCDPLSGFKFDYQLAIITVPNNILVRGSMSISVRSVLEVHCTFCTFRDS